MAGNKKPRKRYISKPVRNTLFLKRSAVECVRGAFTSVQLLAETALPRGTLAPVDVASMLDTFDYVTVLMLAGNVIEESNFDDGTLLTTWNKANDALQALSQRCMNSEDRCTTAWAEEVRAIQEGLEIAGQVLDAELDLEPTWAYRVYLWAHHRVWAKGVRFAIEVGTISAKDAGAVRKALRQKILQFDATTVARIYAEEERMRERELLEKRMGELR